jgi:hypothetical protein
MRRAYRRTSRDRVSGAAKRMRCVRRASRACLRWTPADSSTRPQRASAVDGHGADSVPHVGHLPAPLGCAGGRAGGMAAHPNALRPRLRVCPDRAQRRSRGARVWSVSCKRGAMRRATLLCAAVPLTSAIALAAHTAPALQRGICALRDPSKIRHNAQTPSSARKRLPRWGLPTDFLARRSTPTSHACSAARVQRLPHVWRCCPGRRRT